MNNNEMIDCLHEEIYDAENSIDELVEQIADMQNELSFIEGRRCLACGLLTELEKDE